MNISRLISNIMRASAFLTIAIYSITAHADTTSIGMLNLHRVPQQQLWRFSSWAPQDTTTNGVFITANTIATFAGDDATQMFYRPLAVYTQDGYTVDFWLRVNAVQQAHQGDDAGIVFYPSTTSLFAEVPPQNRDDRVYATLPRGQSIYFDADGIGWGDESDAYAMNTTDSFHHYRVEIHGNGTARVLVDGTPALAHSDFSIHSHIAFGDHSESAGHNGSFSLSALTVSGHATLPAPVDFRPNDCVNFRLDARSTKSVLIAIAGTEALNVYKIDPATVRLNGLTPKGWALRDVDTPDAPPYLGTGGIEDCSFGARDGRQDMVIAFEQRALATSIHNNNGFAELRVTGKFKPQYGDTAFAGDDWVEVRNLPRP